MKRLSLLLLATFVFASLLAVAAVGSMAIMRGHDITVAQIIDPNPCRTFERPDPAPMNAEKSYIVTSGPYGPAIVDSDEEVVGYGVVYLQCYDLPAELMGAVVYARTK